MNRLVSALDRKNTSRPPVWFMRQAGRYHDHYQAIKKDHSFMEMCKDSRLAAEVTFGPIEAFGFDAAILFSDLLFPLESLGMGLVYEPGPKLAFHLKTPADLSRLKTEESAWKGQFEFQEKALGLIRAGLAERKKSDVGLIGFVGAPLTLYFYAAAGSHQSSSETDWKSALAGLSDGRFQGFCEALYPSLLESMRAQARSNPDALAIFDTCAGEIDPVLYGKTSLSSLGHVLRAFKREFPHTKIVYYSKNTDRRYWKQVLDAKDLSIDCLGIDWKTPIKDALNEFGNDVAIQGNIDPDWLLKSPQKLRDDLESYCIELERHASSKLGGWVCGLGHGVLRQTPQDNVRLAVEFLKGRFS